MSASARKPVLPPRPGETIAKKYVLDDVLGEGGMGVVYAGRHSLTSRRVAIKWMKPDHTNDPGRAKRFLLEAQAMGRIDHPSVVSVLDMGQEEGEGAFLVMELMRGESLRDHLDKHMCLAAEQAVSMLLTAMEGVEAAHRAGVIHRDLKPENLFLAKGSDGRPITKVCDFGISKRRDLGSTGVTQTGAVVGTARYMSPEQVAAGEIDARTDVWSLGVILYEMIAGNTPFKGDTFGQILVAIAGCHYEPLDQVAPETPPGVVEVVHRALSKDADARFASVAEMAQALEPFAAAGYRWKEPAAPSMPPPPRAPRQSEQAGVPTATVEPKLIDVHRPSADGLPRTRGSSSGPRAEPSPNPGSDPAIYNAATRAAPRMAMRADPSGAAVASDRERADRGSSREGRRQAHGPTSMAVARPHDTPTGPYEDSSASRDRVPNGNARWIALGIAIFVASAAIGVYLSRDDDGTPPREAARRAEPAREMPTPVEPVAEPIEAPVEVEVAPPPPSDPPRATNEAPAQPPPTETASVTTTSTRATTTRTRRTTPRTTPPTDDRPRQPGGRSGSISREDF